MVSVTLSAMLVYANNLGTVATSQLLLLHPTVQRFVMGHPSTLSTQSQFWHESSLKKPLMEIYLETTSFRSAVVRLECDSLQHTEALGSSTCHGVETKFFLPDSCSNYTQSLQVDIPQCMLCESTSLRMLLIIIAVTL